MDPHPLITPLPSLVDVSRTVGDPPPLLEFLACVEPPRCESTGAPERRGSGRPPRPARAVTTPEEPSLPGFYSSSDSVAGGGSGYDCPSDAIDERLLTDRASILATSHRESTIGMGQNLLLSDRSVLDHLLGAIRKIKTRGPEWAKTA